MSVVGSDCCGVELLDPAPTLPGGAMLQREAPSGLEITGQAEEEADLKPCQTPDAALAPWMTALAPVC